MAVVQDVVVSAIVVSSAPARSAVVARGVQEGARVTSQSENSSRGQPLDVRGGASQAARAAMGDDGAGSSDPFAGQLRRLLSAGGAADGATNSLVFP